MFTTHSYVTQLLTKFLFRLLSKIYLIPFRKKGAGQKNNIQDPLYFK